MKKNKRKHQREKREYEQKREYKRKKEFKTFDLILKEIISKAASKIIWLATGRKVEGKLKLFPAEIRLAKSFYTDILFEIGGEIFQIEIQAQQDKTMPERMFKYYYAIVEKYKKEPTQIVLFVGKGNPPPSEYGTPKLTLKYEVLDMKRIDPDVLIRSRKPEEVVVGVLAGKYREKPEAFSKVVKKISEIVKNEKELLKYMNDINFLASLFDVKIKVKPMPIQIDIKKAPFYRWGREEGFREGKREGIKEGERRGIVKGLKEGEQRGIIKGKREGLKEAILLGVQIKFGRSKIKELKTLLEKVGDLNYLKKIKRRIIEAKTWDDFVKVFRNHNKRA
jgi:predicted transposase YdaD